MTRASDGAFVFNTGLSVGGQALTVKLYRVDDKTLSGVVLTATNGRQALGPVLATRAPITNGAELNGDWNNAYYECEYNSTFTACGQFGTQGFGLSYNINNLVVSGCKRDVRFADCSAADRESYDTLAPKGGGQYGSTTAGDGFLAMTVAGQRLIVNPYRDPHAVNPTFYTGYSIFVPEASLTAAAVDGTWRAFNIVGETGTASISGTLLSTTMAARTTPLAGSIAYNSPWVGLNRVTPTSDPLLRTFLLANTKIGLAVNGEGVLLLTRE